MTKAELDIEREMQQIEELEHIAVVTDLPNVSPRNHSFHASTYHTDAPDTEVDVEQVHGDSPDTDVEHVHTDSPDIDVEHVHTDSPDIDVDLHVDSHDPQTKK